jgi:hypothetical protein
MGKEHLEEFMPPPMALSYTDDNIIHVLNWFLIMARDFRVDEFVKVGICVWAHGMNYCESGNWIKTDGIISDRHARDYNAEKEQTSERTWHELRRNTTLLLVGVWLRASWPICHPPIPPRGWRQGGHCWQILSKRSTVIRHVHKWIRSIRR